MTTTEKFDYQRYLASREWRLKRKEVIERAEGWCERCHSAGIEAIHHLTYERIGHEDSDDLLAVCRPCHDYLAGETEQDPAARAILNQLEITGMTPGVMHKGDWAYILSWDTGPFPSGYFCHIDPRDSPAPKWGETSRAIIKLPGKNIWFHCDWY